MRTWPVAVMRELWEQKQNWNPIRGHVCGDTWLHLCGGVSALGDIQFSRLGRWLGSACCQPQNRTLCCEKPTHQLFWPSRQRARPRRCQTAGRHVGIWHVVPTHGAHYTCWRPAHTNTRMHLNKFTSGRAARRCCYKLRVTAQLFSADLKTLWFAQNQQVIKL